MRASEVSWELFILETSEENVDKATLETSEEIVKFMKSSQDTWLARKCSQYLSTINLIMSWCLTNNHKLGTKHAVCDNINTKLPH